MTDSFKSFGFQYAMRGRRFTFAIHAKDEGEAKRQFEALQTAEFVGELNTAVSPCLQSA